MTLRATKKFAYEHFEFEKFKISKNEKTETLLKALRDNANNYIKYNDYIFRMFGHLIQGDYKLKNKTEKAHNEENQEELYLIIDKNEPQYTQLNTGSHSRQRGGSSTRGSSSRGRAQFGYKFRKINNKKF